jgi:excinuclease ABC subunit A
VAGAGGEGAVADIMQAGDSQTGRYLLHAMKHPLKARRAVAWPPVVNLGSDSNFAPEPAKKQKSIKTKLDSAPRAAAPEVQHWLTVQNAKLHNLQNVTAQVPSSRLVAVTGCQRLRQVHPGA